MATCFAALGADDVGACLAGFMYMLVVVVSGSIEEASWASGGEDEGTKGVTYFWVTDHVLELSQLDVLSMLESGNVPY